MGECADVVRTTVGVARALRRAGLNASPDRVQTWVRALSVLDPVRLADVSHSGRQTMCSSREDLAVFDAVLADYLSGRRPGPEPGLVLHLPATVASPDDDDPDGAPGDAEARALATASRLERLADTDLATVGPDPELLARLAGAFARTGLTRRSARRRPAARGRADRPRTLRRVLASGGEVAEIAHRGRRPRPRRLVLLVDLSGSMSPYGEALLHLAHAATRRPAPRTEVFVIGTRLTRVTGPLSGADAPRAVAAAAAAALDRGGGTRLGELMKEFLDGWGQRGLARGAVVAVVSDGWERGDPRLLGEQMARLSRLAHRVLWANPRKAQPGYEPLAAGMAAALPHVEDFVEGHSINALVALADAMTGHAAPDRPGGHTATQGGIDARPR
ncbi:MAG TPA: VWA domain-containing protein [Acidimicrobiales bacterium]|nr:VWA domain-containing protein [Acidimicrobiales bacterium]